MPISVICPACGRVGKAPERAIGRTARCPECKHVHVLTAELIRDEGDGSDIAPPPTSAPVPAPKPTARPAAVAGFGPTPYSSPFRDPARAPIGGPTVPPVPEGEKGPRPPVPVLVGGGIGVSCLALLAGWGLGLFGGRAPAVDASGPAVAAGVAAPTNPAPMPVPVSAATAAPGEPTPALVGEVSVAALVLLDPPESPDQPVPAPTPAAEAKAGSDVAAATGTGAPAASDPGPARTLTTAEIVAESEPSVAVVRGRNSSGTGFLVGPGLVATNAHVIDDEFASDLEVRFVSADDARKGPIKATLLYEDATRDLALLAVPTDLKPLRVAQAYNFRKGEDVTVIGSPGMGDGQVLENAISRGVMSTRAKVDDKSFYQLNIAINPGNSGGPVFDSAGRVIGVVTLKSVKQEATGYCIPVEDLRSAIARVGAQSTADADQCRSKHRTRVAARTLGGGGALLCLLIDLRRADAQAKNPVVKEARDELESIIEAMEKEVIPTLTVEGQQARQDSALAPPVRKQMGEIQDRFARLRSIVNAKKGVDDGQLHTIKQDYRRLATGLFAALKMEFPKELMIAFDDHAPAQPNFIVMSPSNLGSRLRSRAPGINHGIGGSGRFPSARDRLQQRRNGH